MIMTNEESKSSEPTSENKLFTDQTSPLLTNLLYPSESDEPVEVVTCYLKQEEPLTASQIKEWLMLPPSVYVKETPEADFWEPVLTQQDWYGDDEKSRTNAFQQLHALIEAELAVRQVFQVGESELDIYLLGRQADGTRTGIKTKIVQT